MLFPYEQKLLRVAKIRVPFETTSQHAYLFRFKLRDSDSCPDCDKCDTLEHILTECPRYDVLRHLYFSSSEKMSELSDAEINDLKCLFLSHSFHVLRILRKRFC